jgi:hypothetical protein
MSKDAVRQSPLQAYYYRPDKLAFYLAGEFDIDQGFDICDIGGGSHFKAYAAAFGVFSCVSQFVFY